MKPVIACLLLGLAPLPAVAQEYGFANDGLILELESGRDNYVSLTPAADSMFGPIVAGELDLQLFADPLARVRTAFGGTIQSYDQAGYHTDWLCYTDGTTRTWYLAGERGETPGDGAVDWIVAEPANATTDADYGCVDNPGAMLAPQDFPTIGATREQLAARFGKTIAPGTDRVVYFLQEEIGGEDDGYSLVRTAYYRLRNGTVDALSFSQWDSR